VFVLGFVAGRVMRFGEVSAKVTRHVYTGRHGDVLRVPSVELRCEVSGEGGSPDLFCYHTPTSRYETVFFTDSFLVWRVGNTDSPVFVGRFGQRKSSSKREKAAISLALPREFRVPASCATINIKFSSDPSWARAESIDVYDPATKRCGRFGGNGYWLLKRSDSGHWRIVYNGSEVPPCSIHAPKDLLYPGMKSCWK
jgi:hypothetical protein